VQVALKGVHRVKRRLAAGGFAVHYYAWRGGPKIDADPQSPEFIAQFRAFTAARDTRLPASNTMQGLIDAYLITSDFTDLAPATAKEYRRYIQMIELEFGDMPIAAINMPSVRGVFLDWRDKVAKRGKRTADLAFAVLSRVMSWAYNRRKIIANPCERPGRLHSAGRAASVWDAESLTALFTKASAAVALPCIIAKETGQRQGDILKLTWAAFDGDFIRLRQSKRGRHVTIPVTHELRAALDAAKAVRKGLTICATSRGTAWTSDGFKTSFGKARAAAGVTGLTFHDFRGTAVLQLALSGCSVPEIATITGHSLKDVEAMLDGHYLSRDRALGESAIAKLEKHRSATKL
jgi:integrase